MKHHLARTLVFVLAVTGAAQQEPAASKPLEPIDVMRLRHVTGAWLSPDAATIAFTRTRERRPDETPGTARTELLVMPRGGGEAEVLLDVEARPRGVAWRPDGALVTVLHRGDDDSHDEVWGIPPTGGELQRITETPHGVGSYAWRPDGGAIAFTVTDPRPAERAAAREKGFRPRIVDEDFDHISLWTWSRESGETERLTSGVTVYEFAWSPDGTRLAAAIAPRNLIDDRYMAKRLHTVDPATGEVVKLVDNPGKLGAFAWSPDGERLAYVSAADARDPHAGMLYSISPGDDEPRAHTRGLRGMVHDISWRGDEVLAAVSFGVHTALVTIALEGAAEPATVAHDDDVAFRDFDARGEHVIVVGSTPTHPEEVWSVTDGKLRRLTNSNPWLGEVALGRQEVVQFTARDGVPIEGLLIHPVDFAPGTRYPLVICVHGGPEAHHSHGWLTAYSQPGQVLAGRGYVSWYPNYRASTGYGVAFCKLDHGDPMGGEYRDHLDAIALFAERGLVDPQRVGIVGGSYGGYTSAWAATFGTEHFAAAVSFVPFVDIRTKWYTSDIPREFYWVHYEEKWPHEQVDFLASRSPLTFAPQCRTPLLLLGGDADPRVHPSQPFMLYRAVDTATHTPVRYVQYPGEGHGNRTNTNRYDYLLRSLRWLEHYLREGDHRTDAPPPIDLEYAGW